MIGQSKSPTLSSRGALVQILTERIREFETSRVSRSGVISTGHALLDRMLPAGGVHRGTLVEWLASEAGGGATTLALAAAREACGEVGTLVVVDRWRTFYPLAAAACGIDLSRMFVVRPQNERDESWAIDQALRSGGASAVLAWPDKLDDHLFRRLQLAAEAGDTLGLFVRPARAAAEPSWAEVRLLVEPLASMSARDGRAPRRVQVTILRSPGHAVAQARRVILNIDDGTRHVADSEMIYRTRRERQRKIA